MAQLADWQPHSWLAAGTLVGSLQCWCVSGLLPHHSGQLLCLMGWLCRAESGVECQGRASLLMHAGTRAVSTRRQEGTVTTSVAASQLV